MIPQLEVDGVTLPILDRLGHICGDIRVSRLPPGTAPGKPHPLLDFRADPSADPTLAPVQLLESEEYHYQIRIPQAKAISTDHPDVFEPDTAAGDIGRVRPRLHTGRLPIAVIADGQVVGEVEFEIRSRKLGYQDEFRQMLSDIASKGSEIVMERFAASEQRFSVSDSRDARTLYQRFAFLKSLLLDDVLDAAFHNIIARPHVTWEPVHERRRPGQGMRASSTSSRAIMAAGPRVMAPAHLGLPVPSLPVVVASHRTESTLDNVPNQFVRFALTQWRDIVLDIQENMRRSQGAPRDRGLMEANAVLDYLDALLAEELFREVGQLGAFPAGNQVLQKREGYRDVLRAYLQLELAAKLAWEGGEDIYSAGQKNVAKLYEFWSFIQLAEIVAELCGVSFDLSELIVADARGFGLTLREGKAVTVRGSLTHSRRHIRLELTYNKTFTPPRQGSWSTELRPDCTLEISSGDEDGAWFQPVRLHFDAKYRIESVREVAEQAVPSVPLKAAKRDDILKMHAYRDAIRRSAGAYVLFPGDRPWEKTEFHELLPGIGAFPLRPTIGGVPEGREELKLFIRLVLDHLASQVTQHERGRYWTDRVYARDKPPSAQAPAAPFLRRPAADTRVLLGYVKDENHLRWIHEKGLYNLRATGTRGRVGIRSRELTSDLVVLYGNELDMAEILAVGGVPELHTREEMLQLGYPGPGRRAYFCIPVRPTALGAWENRLTSSKIQELKDQLAPGSPHGRPVSTSWLRVVEAASGLEGTV